jgi:hypothetical protein
MDFVVVRLDPAEVLFRSWPSVTSIFLYIQEHKQDFKLQISFV